VENRTYHGKLAIPSKVVTPSIMDTCIDRVFLLFETFVFVAIFTVIALLRFAIGFEPQTTRVLTYMALGIGAFMWTAMAIMTVIEYVVDSKKDRKTIYFPYTFSMICASMYFGITSITAILLPTENFVETGLTGGACISGLYLCFRIKYFRNAWRKCGEPLIIC
jgi:hypothetical protein